MLLVRGGYNTSQGRPPNWTQVLSIAEAAEISMRPIQTCPQGSFGNDNPNRLMRAHFVVDYEPSKPR